MAPGAWTPVLGLAPLRTLPWDGGSSSSHAAVPLCGALAGVDEPA